MKRFLLAFGLIAAIPAACTSNTAAPPGTTADGGLEDGGICQAPFVTAACTSCMTAHCQSDINAVATGCASVISCYCECKLGDTCCVGACGPDISATSPDASAPSCMTDTQNLATCANANCLSDCTVTIPAASCADAAVDANVPETSTGADAGTGTLWVTDNFAAAPTATPSILGFSVAEAAAGGNVAPKTTISGSNTTLTGPGCVAFDGSGNMWVVDSQGSKMPGQILEFTAANVATGGNVAPAVTISGANTLLTNPAGCAFDSNGTLWVATIDNAEPDNVVAFTATQLAAGGNIAPAITVGNGCNTIDVAFDPTGDLWVSALCTGIQEYTKAELADAGVIPAPVLTFGEATGVNGITFDSAGNFWSTLQGGINAVTEFTPAALAAATPTPTLQISGTGTQMNEPFGLTFANGSLWVAQQGSNALTQYDVTNLVDGGGLVPTAVVSGASTGLNSPSFILFH